MRLVQIALCAQNSKVGSFRANTEAAIATAKEASSQGATLVALPEQIISGYPAQDLVLWPKFVDAQIESLKLFAQETATTSTIYVLGHSLRVSGDVYNVASVVALGRVWGVVPKEKLPNYNVFYESRVFARGVGGRATEVKIGNENVPFGDLLFDTDFGRFGVEVCEDLWSPEGPLQRRAYQGAELVINISASPYRVGVQQTRHELISTRAADAQVTLAYVNAIGGNDGLIFDGGAFINQNGRMLLEAPRFKESIFSAVVDLNRTSRLRSENSTFRNDSEEFVKKTVAARCIEIQKIKSAPCKPTAYENTTRFLPGAAPVPSARVAFCEELLEALSLGLADYYQKSAVFRSLGIALSGGRDSLLTLLIAHRAAQRLRPENPSSLIHTFYMGTRNSSQETRDAAQTIAKELDVPFLYIDIDDAFAREIEATRAMLNGAEPTPITLQNIQARIRAQRMWNWANTSKGLFLQTGNMSEKALGYTTIGGDLMGAVAVISNLPKTVVICLLDYLKEKLGHSGIEKVLARQAGPELAPNQSGEAELMPFEILDACLYLLASEKMSVDEVCEVLPTLCQSETPQSARAHVEKCAKLFATNVYKWVQSPIGLHVGHLDLDRERALQLPVVAEASLP